MTLLTRYAEFNIMNQGLPEETPLIGKKNLKWNNFFLEMFFVYHHKEHFQKCFLHFKNKLLELVFGVSDGILSIWLMSGYAVGL